MTINESSKTQLGSQSRLHSPLDFLVDMVAINSGTLNREGVNRIQHLIQTELDLLGFATEYFTPVDKRFGNLLKGFYSSNKLNAKTITLVVHADTVFELQDEFPIVFNKKENKLIGPGVIDDKGGVVVALKGLFEFLRNQKPNYNIQFISSPNEEMGSPGFNELLVAFGQISDLVLGFEPAHDNGDIISSRFGNRWYKFDVLGIEAHAGRANGEEINAAHELIDKLSRMISLKSKIPGIKINVGHFKGGRDKFNIVCGMSSAKVDTRFVTHAQSEDLHLEILSILDGPKITANTGKEAEVAFSVEDDCPPFEQSRKGDFLKEKYKEILGLNEGRVVCDHLACGASDINYLSQSFNISIDGLGPIGGLMHTTNEFLRIDSLISRSNALSEFLNYLNECQFQGGIFGSN